MLPMFNRIQIVESPGLVVLMTRHRTPELQLWGHCLTAWLGFLMLLHSMLFTLSSVNRAVVDVILFFCPQWPYATALVLCFIIQFILGPILVTLGDRRHFNLFAFFLQTTTVVKIAQDWIETDRQRHPRHLPDEVHFLTACPADTMRMENEQGAAMTVGSLNASNCVYMAYGRCNMAPVTSFLTEKAAGRFALALNAALQSPLPDGAFGFPVVEPLTEQPKAAPIRVKARVIK